MTSQLKAYLIHMHEMHMYRQALFFRFLFLVRDFLGQKIDENGRQPVQSLQG